MKRYQTRSCSIVKLFVFLIFLAGCSSEPNSGKKIAYISTVKNSQYAKTFSDLHLGVLYDFNLKLTEADKSWVTLWVEGYKNGEETDPFRLKELSYGLHPTNKVVEGPIGFGIINPQSDDDVSFFLYSSGVSVPPQTVGNILEGIGATTWGFAIGDEEVALESGETKVLGVYRQSGNSIRTYDYQDINQITQMINEDKTVLLLKIKVEKEN
ncbi:hypothetical protein [Paenibacillus sp. IITD108]|uniref:hypothetical protein n=1 Tax=Paenibacillus sp. IITD108 TaxID=3116649 RepID=UPI002F404154